MKDLVNWIGLCSVLRPRQHSIGYMGDGFYRSKDPTNSIKVLKEKAVKENNPKKKENITHMQLTEMLCTNICVFDTIMVLGERCPMWASTGE